MGVSGSPISLRLCHWPKNLDAGGGIRVANIGPVSAQILETKANPEADFTNNPDRQSQPVMPEKGNIYRAEIRNDTLTVSASDPVRVHRQFIQRQQHYTGDA